MTSQSCLRLFALLCAAASALCAAYTYDYAQAPVITDATRWQTSGSATFTSSGVTFSGTGGSLISKIAMSGVNGADYEINTTLGLASAGGVYDFFSEPAHLPCSTAVATISQLD